MVVVVVAWLGGCCNGGMVGVVVMVAWLAFVVLVGWLVLWLRWLLCG